MRRCTLIQIDLSVAITTCLPMRLTELMRCPLNPRGKASASFWSMIFSSRIVRPTINGDSWFATVSTSGSSGMDR